MLNVVSNPSSVLKKDGVPALGIYELFSPDDSIAFQIDPITKRIIINTGTGGPFAITDVDVVDNDTVAVLLGDTSEISQALLDYVYISQGTQKKHGGKLIVSHENGVADVIHDEFSFKEGSEVEGLSFGASILGTSLRLEITASGIGENGKFVFSKKTKPNF